jgi:hypothetical protein
MVLAAARTVIRRDMKYALVWRLASILPVASGCALFGAGGGGGADSHEWGPEEDRKLVGALAQLKGQIDENPGDLSRARRLAELVVVGDEEGVYHRTDSELAVDVKFAVVAFRAVVDPELVTAARIGEAMMHGNLGDTARQGRVLEEAYGVDPSFGSWEPLVLWVGKHGHDARVVELCAAQRAGMAYGRGLARVFDDCVIARGGGPLERTLDFASADDRAWFANAQAAANVQADPGK